MIERLMHDARIRIDVSYYNIICCQLIYWTVHVFLYEYAAHCRNSDPCENSDPGSKKHPFRRLTLYSFSSGYRQCDNTVKR